MASALTVSCLKSARCHFICRRLKLIGRITGVAATRREGRALGDEARPAISALVFKKRDPIGRSFVRSAGRKRKRKKPQPRPNLIVSPRQESFYRHQVEKIAGSSAC